MKEAIFRLKKVPIRCRSIMSLNYDHFFLMSPAKPKKCKCSRMIGKGAIRNQKKDLSTLFKRVLQLRAAS